MSSELTCPKCKSANVIFSKKRQRHFCEDCEHEFVVDKPVVPLRIFLSYGHDDNEELVRLIRADLEKRGHDVWFDKSEIKAGDDWRRAITEGIVGSHKFVSFLSKHSTRDPGVCRDEIAVAIGVKGGNIQTILVESEQEVQPPVNIGHIQWLDMHDWQERRATGEAAWEQWYQAKLADIVRVVESDESRRFAGEIETLHEHLKPIRSEARICQLLSKGFYGREWLFQAVEEWRRAPSPGSRLFWITGDPGVGKSAFAAQFMHTRSDAVIAAQFVQWHDADHRDARRVIRSIAFQLATRLPDYRKLLLTLPEIKGEQLDRKNADELFDYLLANPLRSVIGGGRERYLIVVDALDEAGDSQNNPLVTMFARHIDRLPDWLGVVVTSRPESAVQSPLQKWNPKVLDTRTEANRADLREFLRRQLAPQLRDRPDADRVVEQILDKSEGVFLYVERFCDDVQQNHVSLDRPDQFPQGLGGIFDQWFERQFPDLDKFRKDVRPALRAILAAREPLPLDILQRLFHWQDEELRDFTRTLGSLFPVTKEASSEVIQPCHKSLTDWLADEGKAGVYFVSVAEGDRLLQDFCSQDYLDNRGWWSHYTVKHLLFYLVTSNCWTRLRCVLKDSAFIDKIVRETSAISFLDDLDELLAKLVEVKNVLYMFVFGSVADFRHERGALHSQVFPWLSDWCQRRGSQLHVIDFAWQLSGAAIGLDFSIPTVFYRTFRGSRIQGNDHYSLFLIGDRYGWRPLPEEISLVEYQMLADAVATDPAALQVLKDWYRRDENAVPPVHVLRWRFDSPDGRDYGLDEATRHDSPAWQEVQAAMWAIINRAFPQEQLDRRFAPDNLAASSIPSIVRFQASFDEQVIWHVALQAPDAAQRVFALVRKLSNIDGCVADARPEQKLGDFVDLMRDKSQDYVARQAQSQLLKALENRLGTNGNREITAVAQLHLDPATGRFDVSTDHLQPLCDSAGEKLLAVLSRQVDDSRRRFLVDSGPDLHALNVSQQGLELELNRQARYIDCVAPPNSFVGRECETQHILDYLLGDDRWPLVIHGPSGIGKSALLAHTARFAERRFGQSPIVRFVATTSRSGNIRSLLTSICLQLRRRLGQSGEPPTDIRELVSDFNQLLLHASQPVWIFLDALDQLSDMDNGRQLNWIYRMPLPENIRLVVSCLSGCATDDPSGQPYATLHRRGIPEENFLELSGLSYEEARVLLFDRLLHQDGRVVNVRQRSLITERLEYSEVYRHPICIKQLFEEARLWKSYDSAPDLGDDIRSLFRQFVKRLNRRPAYGEELIRPMLAFMSMCRSGLSEIELLDLLSLTSDELKTRVIPQAIFQSLLGEMEPYLRSSEVHGIRVLSFYHDMISCIARETARAGTRSMCDWHKTLANYFEQQSFRELPDGSLVPNVRAIMEAAYQFSKVVEAEL